MGLREEGGEEGIFTHSDVSMFIYTHTHISIDPDPVRFFNIYIYIHIINSLFYPDPVRQSVVRTSLATAPVVASSRICSAVSPPPSFLVLPSSFSSIRCTNSSRSLCVGGWVVGGMPALGLFRSEALRTMQHGRRTTTDTNKERHTKTTQTTKIQHPPDVRVQLRLPRRLLVPLRLGRRLLARGHRLLLLWRWV